MTKSCTHCHLQKETADFYRQGRYLSSACKPCYNARQKERYYKVCTKCLRSRRRTFFYRQNRGISSMCKPCYIAYMSRRNRARKNRDKEDSPTLLERVAGLVTGRRGR